MMRGDRRFRGVNHYGGALPVVGARSTFKRQRLLSLQVVLYCAIKDRHASCIMLIHALSVCMIVWITILTCSEAYWRWRISVSHRFLAICANESTASGNPTNPIAQSYPQVQAKN
jgi:hypothetical protein